MKKNKMIVPLTLGLFLFTFSAFNNISADSSSDTHTGISLSGWGDNTSNGGNTGGGDTGGGDNTGNSGENKPNKPSIPSWVIPKKTAVYAMKPIYMYKSTTFYKKNRIAKYKKQARVNRPMFVVKDYGYSKNGTLRYKVQDVNHKSKTHDKIGYVTARKDFARPVYYKKMYKKLTVVSPRGINSYSNKNLKRKVKHYKQGTKIKVKKIVKHNLTSRYILNNGKYISGNRKLIMYGNRKQPKKLKIKQEINLYKDLNLKHKIKKLNKYKVLNIKAWYYSNENNFSKGNTKRYLVDGGFITANSKLVKIKK